MVRSQRRNNGQLKKSRSLNRRAVRVNNRDVSGLSGGLIEGKASLLNVG